MLEPGPIEINLDGDEMLNNLTFDQQKLNYQSLSSSEDVNSAMD